MPAARRGMGIAAFVLVGAASASDAQIPALAVVDSLAQAARSERADLLSPGHYTTGEALHAAVRRELAEERAGKDVERRARAEGRIRRAEAEYRLALATAARARTTLGSSLAARDSAVAAGAPRAAAEVFARGDRLFSEAALAVEAGKAREAVIKAADAERRFREAELIAVKETVLGEAERLMARGEAEAAGLSAPRTFGKARDLLLQARRRLEEDRTRRDESLALAGQAEAEARRALAIAARARAAKEDPSVVEAVILDGEAQLREVAESLGIQPDFAAGSEENTRRMVEAVKAMKAERDSVSAEIASLANEVEATRSRERGLAAELEGSRDRQARLRRVRELFTPAEATILRQGGHLILRLKGITFPAKASDLLPENFPLLAKVIQAIRELPGAALTIEGHTDSQGDAVKNLALSEARAQAVRAYLEANLDLSDRLVSAVGHGEDSPIASNDTEEGRAQNRRIDLVFDAPALIGE